MDDDDSTLQLLDATTTTSLFNPTTTTTNTSTSTATTTTTTTLGQTGLISPLEQDVLDEYERLSRNMNQLAATLTTLSKGPMTLEIAEGLRLLERKVASVYTLLKASVYSIVLQQGQFDDADAAAAAAAAAAAEHENENEGSETTITG